MPIEYLGELKKEKKEKKEKKVKKVKEAFTLVELVIVLVILAILVSLALPTFMGARQRAYRAEALQTLSELKTLAWAYNLEQGGVPGSSVVWPTTPNDLGYGNVNNITLDNWVIESIGDDEDSAYEGLDCSQRNCFIAVANGINAADGLPSCSLVIDPNGSVYIQ